MAAAGYTLGARALSFIAMVDATYGPSLRQSASELSQARHTPPYLPASPLHLPISPLYLRLRAEPGAIALANPNLNPSPSPSPNPNPNQAASEMVAPVSEKLVEYTSHYTSSLARNSTARQRSEP